MKKKILLFIGLLLLPTLVNAKEYCTIVSGNGKDIGSEIACGTEHFYIINNDENNIKMLSKYNLYVGFNIDKIKIDKTKTYIRQECKENGSCYLNRKYIFNEEEVTEAEWYNKLGINRIDLLSFPNRSKWNYAFGDEKHSEIYTLEGKKYRNEYYEKLYPYYTIDEEDIDFGIQNSIAKGVTGEKGNADYPIYGVTYLFPPSGDYNDNYNFTLDGTLNNFENGYTDFGIKNDYLNYYKRFLIDKGYNISEINLISIEEINSIVKKITNKDLPLSEWYELSINNEKVEDEDSNYYNLGDLKQYLSNDYNWLWDTSYWTKTFMGNYNSNSNEYLRQSYFVSSSGEICYSYSDCSSGIPRAGIRPVVTISKDMIKYNIYTKTDGNGTIEVVDSAFGGESISFRVSAKKGLKLAGLTITTDAGEKIEFREEDLTTNKDGTISISTNKFTMPFDNVTIEARWSSINDIVNPKTGMKVGGLILLFTTITGITIYTKRKNSLKQ